jgi:hypothetical protein
MRFGAVCGLFAVVAGCGPTAATTGADDRGSEGTGGDTASSVTTTTSATTETTMQSSGAIDTTSDETKLDVAGDPKPDPLLPCIYPQELEPTECYRRDLVYSATDDVWMLETPDAHGCALVCLETSCITDACVVTGVLDIRVVHDGGPRLIVEAPSTDLLETVDRQGVEVERAEGWNERVHIYVAHPIDDDSMYSVWATDAAGQQPLWGPVAMQPFGP